MLKVFKLMNIEYNILLYVHTYSLKKAERPDYVITIEPDYDTDYGEWNGGVYCPEKEYAHGFKQKTDAWCSGGGECTGLNGIG